MRVDHALHHRCGVLDEVIELGVPHVGIVTALGDGNGQITLLAGMFVHVGEAVGQADDCFRQQGLHPGKFPAHEIDLCGNLGRAFVQQAMKLLQQFLFLSFRGLPGLGVPCRLLRGRGGDGQPTNRGQHQGGPHGYSVTGQVCEGGCGAYQQDPAKPQQEVFVQEIHG